MPEIIVEKINTEIKFNRKDNDSIAGQISDNFKSWDSSRSTQLASIRTIGKLLDDLDALGCKNDPDTVNNNYSTGCNDLKYTLKDSSIKRIFNSSVANTYNSLFKTPAKLIDVELANPATDEQKIEFAYQQKASLLQILKKSRAKKALKVDFPELANYNI